MIIQNVHTPYMDAAPNTYKNYIITALDINCVDT